MGAAMAGGEAEKNAVVLITGGTDGLGRAAAMLLAESGYRVFAVGRSAEKCTQLQETAAQKHLLLESFAVDVCDQSSVEHGVAAVLTKAGVIDVLINNAGVAYTATVEDMSMEDWRKQFETNVFGVVRMTQAVLPHMRARSQGRILMTSSVLGLISPPGQGAYSATKHALEALSAALRYELYPFGIATVLVVPGYIDTGIQQKGKALAKPYEAKFKTGPYANVYVGAQKAESSLSSGMTPEDYARVILRAVRAKTPEIRYSVGRRPRMVKLAKRLLPDSALDAFIRKQYGIT